MNPHIIVVKLPDGSVDVLRKYATRKPIIFVDEERALKMAKRLGHTGAQSEYIVGSAELLFEERV